jgi:hypothetical protein
LALSLIAFNSRRAEFETKEDDEDCGNPGVGGASVKTNAMNPSKFLRMLLFLL